MYSQNLGTCASCKFQWSTLVVREGVVLNSRTNISTVASLILIYALF